MQGGQANYVYSLLRQQLNPPAPLLPLETAATTNSRPLVPLMASGAPSRRPPSLWNRLCSSPRPYIKLPATPSCSALPTAPHALLTHPSRWPPLIRSTAGTPVSLLRRRPLVRRYEAPSSYLVLCFAAGKYRHSTPPSTETIIEFAMLRASLRAKHLSKPSLQASDWLRSGEPPSSAAANCSPLAVNPHQTATARSRSYGPELLGFWSNQG